MLIEVYVPVHSCVRQVYTHTLQSVLKISHLHSTFNPSCYYSPIFDFSFKDVYHFLFFCFCFPKRPSFDYISKTQLIALTQVFVTRPLCHSYKHISSCWLFINPTFNPFLCILGIVVKNECWTEEWPTISEVLLIILQLSSHLVSHRVVSVKICDPPVWTFNLREANGNFQHAERTNFSFSSPYSPKVYRVKWIFPSDALTHLTNKPIPRTWVPFSSTRGKWRSIRN